MGQKKYRRFGFAIDRAKGDKFAEVLAKAGKTPLQWFKEQVDSVINTTVTVVPKVTETSPKAPRKPGRNRPHPTDEMITRWAALRKEGFTYDQIVAGPDGHGYVKSTIFKCLRARDG